VHDRAKLFFRRTDIETDLRSIRAITSQLMSSCKLAITTAITSLHYLLYSALNLLIGCSDVTVYF